MARKTVFQQLSDLFGPEKSTRENKSRYSLNDKELLKTQSKEEYDYQKLQLQQDAYLNNQWKKVDNEIYQHSIYYETTRLSRDPTGPFCTASRLGPGHDLHGRNCHHRRPRTGHALGLRPRCCGTARANSCGYTG